MRRAWEGEAGKGLFDGCHYKGILFIFSTSDLKEEEEAASYCWTWI